MTDQPPQLESSNVVVGFGRSMRDIPDKPRGQLEEEMLKLTNAMLIEDKAERERYYDAKRDAFSVVALAISRRGFNPALPVHWRAHDFEVWDQITELIIGLADKTPPKG